MRKTLTALVALGTATVLAVSASPASASGTYSGLAYIYGGGGWYDDFGNEGILSTNTNTNSNATCLWQKILWAKGYLPWDDIDGRYGPQTTAATKEWQSNVYGDRNGAADDEAFSWATNTPDGEIERLQYVSGGTGDGQSLTLKYVDHHGWFYLYRNTDGNYEFYDRNGTRRAAGYNYLTCS